MSATSAIKKDSFQGMNELPSEMRLEIVSFLDVDTLLNLTLVSESWKETATCELRNKERAILNLSKSIRKLLNNYFNLRSLPVTSNPTSLKDSVALFDGKFKSLKVSGIKFVVKENTKYPPPFQGCLLFVGTDANSPSYGILHPESGLNANVKNWSGTFSVLEDSFKSLLNGTHPCYSHTIPANHPSLRPNPPVLAAPPVVSPPPPVPPPASPSIREPLWELASAGGRLMKQAAPFVCAAAVAFVAYRYFAHNFK